MAVPCSKEHYCKGWANGNVMADELALKMTADSKCSIGWQQQSKRDEHNMAVSE
jgi:hypothetical protein